MLRTLAAAALLAGTAFAAVPPTTPPSSAVTVGNGTGMTIVYLYIAGCGESEGNDWGDMESWATDYLGDDVLPAGDETVLQLRDGCYVVEPHYADGTAISEQVTVSGPTEVWLTLGG